MTGIGDVRNIGKDAYFVSKNLTGRVQEVQELVGREQANVTQQACLINTLLVSQVREQLVYALVPGAPEPEVVQEVRRLHENLGHYSKKDMLRLLRHAGATPEAMKAANGLQCSVCDENEKHKIQRPRAVPDMSPPFQTVSYDVKEIPGWRPGEKRAFLGIIDHGSRIHAGKVMSVITPTAGEQRQAWIERWKTPYGAPDLAFCDMARNNVGGEMLQGFESDSTKLIPIAGEAHWQLGYVERHNGVFCEALRTAINALNPQSETEYLQIVDQVLEAKNRLVRRLGHSPFQIAFGRDPKIADSLLDDEYNVASADLSSNEPVYQRATKVRLECRLAVLRAADSETIRQTVRTRPRPYRAFGVGDQVFYYRKQRHREPGYWRGIATVIGVEQGNIWVAHSDQVLKCAAEHLRFASPDERLSIEVVSQILRRAQHQLGSGRRGAFRFTDLTGTEHPPTEQAENENDPSQDDAAQVLARNIVNTRDHQDVINNQPGSSGSSSSSSSSGLPAVSPPRAPPEEGARPFGLPAPPDAPPPPAPTSSSPSFAELRRRHEQGESLPHYGPLPARAGGPDTGPYARPSESVSASSGSAAPPVHEEPAGNEEASSPTKKRSPERSERPVRMRRRITHGALLSPPRQPGQNEQVGESSGSNFVGNVEHVQAMDRLLGRTDAITIGEEDEFEIENNGPRRGDGLRPKGSEVYVNLNPEEDIKDVYLLYNPIEDVLISSGANKKANGVIREKDLSAGDLAKFNHAQLKEFQTVLYEKKAVRVLSPEESALARANLGHRIITSMFALKWKEENDCGVSEKMAKARWALRGCVDPGLKELVWSKNTQSPTLSLEASHLIVQLCASHNRSLCIGDVKGAFMESPPLERKNGNIFASLPRGGIPGSGVRPDQLVEVILPLYGLNGAPQRWWATVTEELGKAKGSRSVFDGCLHYVFEEDERTGKKKLCGVLGHHVEDFVGGGRGATWDLFKKYVKDRFPFRKWTEREGTFCGAVVKQNPDGDITVTQRDFAEKMKFITIPKGVSPDARVPETAVSQLRGVFGGGNWLGTQSRPDICAQVSLGMQQVSKATWSTVHLANNMVRRARLDKDLGLRFRPIEPARLTAFAASDASQHNACENGTQGGYLVMFGQQGISDGAVSPVSPAVWKSYRLRRAAGSTLSSETQACKDAMAHLVFMLNLLGESTGDYPLLRRNDTIRKYESGVIIDCKSLYDHAHSLPSPTASSSDKFTAVDFTILREVARDSGVSVRWAPGAFQIADGLTKDKEEPCLRLKGVLREGAFQLAESGECLRQNRLGKERKQRLKELNVSNHLKVLDSTTNTTEKAAANKSERSADVPAEPVVVMPVWVSPEEAGTTRSLWACVLQ